jgi:PAS domain S-box-containing protein
MQFDIWLPWGRLAFMPPTAIEYAVLGLAVLLGAALAMHSWRRGPRISWPLLGLLLALLLAAPVVSSTLVVRFSDANLLPPPGTPARQPPRIAPIIALLPMITAAAWLGPTPAMVVGIVAGVSRAALIPSHMLDLVYYVACAYLCGSLLMQPGPGWLARTLRQPVIAGPLSAMLALPALALAAYVPYWLWGLSGVEYALSYVAAQLAPFLVQALAAGAVLQIAYYAAPARKPDTPRRGVPSVAGSLWRRQASILLSLVLVATALSVVVSGGSAERVAEELAADGLARGARSAAVQAPYFVQTAQSILAALAGDERLAGEIPAELGMLLQESLRAPPFFIQLLLVDETGRMLVASPADAAAVTELSESEYGLLERALGSGTVQHGVGDRLSDGAAYASFVGPVTAVPAGPRRALVGRARLDTNPVLGLIRSALASTHERAEALLVAEDGRIIVHSDPALLATVWDSDAHWRPGDQTGEPWTGYVRSPRDGSRQLAHLAPVEGLPWRVVILLPASVVTGAAIAMAAPTLVLLWCLSAAVGVATLAAARSLAKPLTALTADANRIADGDLTRPVAARGDGEVRQVAAALERVRVRLGDRLDDLSRLLDLSRSARSTMDVRQGLSMIVEGALDATQAQVARAVLLESDGVKLSVGRGEIRRGVRDLDRALFAVVGERDSPFQVEELSELVAAVSDAEQGDVQLRRAIVLPLRSAGLLTAIIWLGHREPGATDRATLETLGTLAEQARVIVETARSYEFVEDERRLLAAVLDSSSEGVLAADPDGLLVRCNRAAEELLGVSADEVFGKDPSILERHSAIADMFSMPLVEGKPATADLPLPDGKTCSCSVFLIVGERGERLGRVVILRDVTALRELDAARAHLVKRVSRGLRRPLTLIHGYAKMLARAGSLAGQQREFVGSILESVQQMGRLVQDLEAGSGETGGGQASTRIPIQLSSIVRHSIAGAEAGARARGVFLRVGRIDPSATVAGDQVQLRRAVDSLIGYTVGAALPGDAVAVDLDATAGVAKLSIGAATRGTERPVGGQEDFPARDEARMGTPPQSALARVGAIAERHGGSLRLVRRGEDTLMYELVLPCDTTEPGQGPTAG